MRLHFLSTSIVLILATGQLVPISSFARVVLRCEDTTSSGDAQAITTCQWGCYRRCLGGLVAQTDAGVSAMDIMITGDDLKLCLDELPDHCRLHGSIFSYAILNYYCADLTSAQQQTIESGEATKETSNTELMYKINIPRKPSDINLYATTFAPTDTSLGLSGRVPSDVCLTNSGFKVSAMSDQTYDHCNSLSVEEGSSVLTEQNLTYPYFSTNRLDIPIDTIATNLANFQRGLQTTDNHLMITTTTNCYVQKPDVIYLFTKGNFTMTTGAYAARDAMSVFTIIGFLTLVFAF